ncbi:MAG: hypothetical protein A2Y77_09110 [Planctomycetes bacterium RBG_13_62_9]|nr:MAG: hypothetical protein A2Y77_09110 [Planctomycetes bacterium RBG_13_62_9]
MKQLFVLLSVVACLATPATSLGAEFIVNGDFEAGDTGFDSDYSNSDPIGDPGVYRVGTSPGALYAPWASFADHTPVGPGNMMIINAATEADMVVWGQEVTGLTAGTDYEFSYWVALSYEYTGTPYLDATYGWVDTNPPVLRCFINGVQVGEFDAEFVTVGGWTKVSYTWNSGAATSATIELIETTLMFWGCDFALDDISLMNTEPVGCDSATGAGPRILSKGTWFMYNAYPGGPYDIQAGNPKDGLNIIGEYWIEDNGDDTYTAYYDIDDNIEIDGIIYEIEVTGEHLGISNSPNFTAKPGQDDNQDFGVEFYDADGVFYIFAHFEVEYW